MIFSSMEALKSYILSKSEVAIKLAQEKVYQVINRFVKEYYAEFSPEVYERTYQLFRSLVKTGVKRTGNGWVAEVYFDASNLDYKIKHLHGYPVSDGYMNPFNRDISSDGTFQNPKGDADKVLQAAAHGSHGGISSGTAIWDDSLIVLNAEAHSMLKKALIDAGIPVR